MIRERKVLLPRRVCDFRRPDRASKPETAEGQSGRMEAHSTECECKATFCYLTMAAHVVAMNGLAMPEGKGRKRIVLKCPTWEIYTGGDYGKTGTVSELA